MAQDLDLDIVVEDSGGALRRWLALGAVIVVAVLAGVLAYLFYFREAEDTELEAAIEEVEVTVGALTSTLFTTGAAAASRRSELTFAAAGKVQSVEVELGDSLTAGQVLARLDDRDASRQVEVQQANLEQARIKLEQLKEPPTESALASARQSVSSAKQGVASANQGVASAKQGVASAEVQVLSARLDLDQLQEPPTAAQIAAADSSVKQAEATLEALRASPTAAQIASADASVKQAEASLQSLTEPATASQIASADASVEQARAALEMLQAPPSEADIASADADVFQSKNAQVAAERQVATALASLGSALNSYCNNWTALEEVCHADAIPLSDGDLAKLNELLRRRVADSPTITAGISQLIQADASYKGALDSLENAKVSLGTAMKRRADIDVPPSDQEVLKAESALDAAVAQREALDDPLSPYEVEQARAALESAQANRAALDDPAPQYEIDRAVAALESGIEARAALDETVSQAEIDRAAAAVLSAEASVLAAKASLATADASVVTAGASLASAQANLADLMEGASDSEIGIQEQDVRLAEISLLQAQDQLQDLMLTAPYDGVIASVGVVPGDVASASTGAFVFLDPASIGVDITVSESDLVGLAPGQLAIAQFDSIQDQSYLLQISGIDTDPTVTQGVVTYTVRAEMVDPRQLADREDEVRQLASLVRGAGALAEGGFAPGASAPQAAGGRGAGGFGGGGGAGLQECVQRVLGRIPQGRGDVSAEERTRIQQECLGGGSGAGRGPQEGGGGPQAARVEAPTRMPTPGMSGSVTILTDIKSDVLLAPSAAIRQQGSDAFVYVRGFDGSPERREITIGGTDSERTEVLSGLAEGDMVLMGPGVLAFQSGGSELTPLRQVR